jgi:hypothetical protein
MLLAALLQMCAEFDAALRSPTLIAACVLHVQRQALCRRLFRSVAAQLISCLLIAAVQCLPFCCISVV